MSNSSIKNIVVTGATRGLGRAMVDGMIAAGHQVAGVGRSAEAILELTDQYASPHLWQTLDVTDSQTVIRWAEHVLKKIGPPDLLINNAAIINANAPLWDVPTQEFSDVIDVNIKGVHNVIRAFVPAMIERGTGLIVNFSSGWGRSTAPEVAPYCATKWAIEGMTQAMSQELPQGIATVALNPGVINTDMLQSCFGAGASTYPTAEQWAKRAVPFLLQLDASNNGDALSVP